MATFQISQWAPINETAYDLYVERTNFDGFHLGSFAYGVQTVVAFQTIKALFRLRKSQKAFFYSLLAYVVVIFIFATLGNAANIKLVELAYVENREYPGGPNAYLLEEGSLITINLVGYAVYIMATWMQDGFLLYRFLVVFNWKRTFAVVPCLVYLLSIVSSVLLLVQLCGGAELFSGSTVNFAVMYWASSITTTLMLTISIVGKLLYMRYQLSRSFGHRGGSLGPYLTISAMLIESAILYSLFALAFLILFAKNDPFQNVLFPALGQVQIISPQLIILRVANGRSFTTTTLRSEIAGGRIPISVQVEMSNVSRTTPSYSSNKMYTVNTTQAGWQDAQVEEHLGKIPNSGRSTEGIESSF